jgi:L-lactate utilization protein LutC
MTIRVAAPTELRLDEELVESFLAAAVRSAARVRRTADGGAANAVVAALIEHGANSAYVATDLGTRLAGVRGACTRAGVEVADYAALAEDRRGLAAVDAAITGCLAAVAATGSVVTSAAAGRGSALVAPLHICVVESRQIVAGLADLFANWHGFLHGSLVSLQTGPSRTADIEKTLVIGAHGPRIVEIILVHAD